MLFYRQSPEFMFVFLLLQMPPKLRVFADGFQLDVRNVTLKMDIKDPSADLLGFLCLAIHVLDKHSLFWVCSLSILFEENFWVQTPFKLFFFKAIGLIWKFPANVFAFVYCLLPLSKNKSFPFSFWIRGLDPVTVLTLWKAPVDVSCGTKENGEQTAPGSDSPFTLFVYCLRSA